MYMYICTSTHSGRREQRSPNQVSHHSNTHIAAKLFYIYIYMLYMCVYMYRCIRIPSALSMYLLQYTLHLSPYISIYIYIYCYAHCFLLDKFTSTHSGRSEQRSPNRVLHHSNAHIAAKVFCLYIYMCIYTYISIHVCIHVYVNLQLYLSVGMSWAMSYELFHMYPEQHINIVQNQFGSANKCYCALPPIPQLFYNINLPPRIQEEGSKGRRTEFRTRAAHARLQKGHRQ